MILIHAPEGEGHRVLGPCVLRLGKSKDRAVHIGHFAGQVPVALPLLCSPLPSPISVLLDLPQLLLQPARPPSLLLYSSLGFCMHQILDPP